MKTLTKPLPKNLPMGFHFDAGKHVYTLDGKPLMGVTSVLGVVAKPALIQWAANMAVDYIENGVHLPKDLGHDYPFTFSSESFFLLCKEARKAHAKKRDTAATSGTDLHALIEEYVQDSIEHEEGIPTAVLGIDKWKPIIAFTEWAKTEEVRFLATEKRMYSKELHIAGTCDLVFEKDGKTYIGDVKTYKKLWDRLPMLQCAAYGLMYEEIHKGAFYRTDTAIPGNKIDGYCIIRIKDSDFEVKWGYDVEGDTRGFLAALELYKTLKNW